MQLIILGNSTCTSPYNGTQPISLRLEGALPNHYYELSHPTNIVSTSAGSDTAREVTEWLLTDANGNATFVFNNDPNADYVTRGIENQWLLPAGAYQFAARQFEDVNWATAVYATFTISGTAASAVTSLRRLRGKKK